MSRATRILVAALGCAALFVAAAASAQTTTLSEKRTFEVVSVDGNKVVVKTEGGTREVTLPPDFKANMDGKEIGLADIKPGMKGSAVVTTKVTSSPVVVTEVKNAEVLNVSGNTIIVRGSDGIKKYTAQDVKDRNVSIIREGEKVDISQLRPGDRLTATIITKKAPVVTTERDIKASVDSSSSSSKMASKAASAPAPAPAAASAPPPAPAASASSSTTSSSSTSSSSMSSDTGSSTKMAKKLPKTGTHLPAAAGLGLLSLAAGLGLTIRRRKAA